MSRGLKQLTSKYENEYTKLNAKLKTNRKDAADVVKQVKLAVRGSLMFPLGFLFHIKRRALAFLLARHY
jgi:hypothetical protein